MSAQGWEGRRLQIALAGVILAAVRTKSVSFTNDTIDLTEGERNGYRRLAERGDVKAGQVQVDGVATAENYQVLRELWAGDTWGELEIWNPDGTVIPSRAFLAGLDRSGEKEGFVTFAATLLLDVSVFSAREAGTSGSGFVPIAPEYVTSHPYSAEPPTEYEWWNLAEWADGYKIYWLGPTGGWHDMALEPLAPECGTAEFVDGVFTVSGMTDYVSPFPSGFMVVPNTPEVDATAVRVTVESLSIASEDETVQLDVGSFRQFAGASMQLDPNVRIITDGAPPLTIADADPTEIEGAPEVPLGTTATAGLGFEVVFFVESATTFEWSGVLEMYARP